MINLSPNSLRASYLAGKITPTTVVEWVLSRMNDADQEAVWISKPRPNSILDQAKLLESRVNDINSLPLFGLPFSVKDCIDVENEPTTCACSDFKYIANASSTVVKAALSAGAIYVGKTNLDQFATGLVGVRSDFGIPKNPHAPDYIPGGSSSGAAVSVATGIVSFAFGTDTGGSGRIPASYCGITGLKPAPGALSRFGVVAACRSFDTISIYVNEPDEALGIFESVLRYDPRDPFSISTYDLHQYDNSNECRIAVPQNKQLEFFGNRETERIFLSSLQDLRRITKETQEIDFNPFLTINELMFFGPFVSERFVSVGEFLEKHPNAGLPVVRELILGSKSNTAVDAYRAAHLVAETRSKLSNFWTKYDALMVPTVGTVVTLKEALSDPLTPSFNNGYYTNFANPLGLASISVPYDTTSDGVPYGVTFLAPSQEERKLTSIAKNFLSAISLQGKANTLSQ